MSPIVAAATHASAAGVTRSERRNLMAIAFHRKRPKHGRQTSVCWFRMAARPLERPAAARPLHP